VILEIRNKIEVFNSRVRCSSITKLVLPVNSFIIAGILYFISHNIFNRLRLVEKGEEQFSVSHRGAAFFKI
jgi:hypothetical protein